MRQYKIISVIESILDGDDAHARAPLYATSSLQPVDLLKLTVHRANVCVDLTVTQIVEMCIFDFTFNDLMAFFCLCLVSVVFLCLRFFVKT